MEAEIKLIIAEVCWINPVDIDDDGDLIGYGLDSARSMDLVVALEQRFGIEIPDDAVSQLRTVRDVVALVRSKAAA